MLTIRMLQEYTNTHIHHYNYTMERLRKTLFEKEIAITDTRQFVKFVCVHFATLGNKLLLAQKMILPAASSQVLFVLFFCYILRCFRESNPLLNRKGCILCFS